MKAGQGKLQRPGLGMGRGRGRGSGCSTSTGSWRPLWRRDICCPGTLRNECLQRLRKVRGGRRSPLFSPAFHSLVPGGLQALPLSSGSVLLPTLAYLCFIRK